jgi:hypothetical protein
MKFMEWEKFREDIRAMKGIINGNTILLEDQLPPDFRDGDQVEVLIVPKGKSDHPIPVFNLSVKSNDFPTISIGHWPDDVHFRREDLYDDWGR